MTMHIHEMFQNDSHESLKAIRKLWLPQTYAHLNMYEVEKKEQIMSEQFFTSALALTRFLFCFVVLGFFFFYLQTDHHGHCSGLSWAVTEF